MPNGIEFNTCFYTGEIDFEESLKGRGAAIATALGGWATCGIATKIPENFGRAMVKIGQFLGEHVGNEKRLLEMADEWQKENNITSNKGMFSVELYEFRKTLNNLEQKFHLNLRNEIFNITIN